MPSVGRASLKGTVRLGATFTAPREGMARSFVANVDLLKSRRVLPLLTRALVIAIFAVFTIGCGREQRSELRLAFAPWPGSEFFYLAKEKGFFAEEGLKVRLVEYSSLSDSRVAFEIGQVDAMSATLIEVLQAQEHSQQKSEVVLVTDYSNGADVILARSNLTSVSALKGRRVGLEMGTLGGFMLGRALELHGLKHDDVEIVSCATGSMEAALADGSVDAVVTYPPTSISLESSRQVRRLFSSAEIPGEVVDVVAVNADFLQRRPEIAARLHRVFQRALDYARKNRQDAYGIMGQREGLSAKEFEEALVGIQMVDAAGQTAFLGPQGSLTHSLADVEQTLRRTGQLRGSKPISVLPAGKGTESP